MKVKLEDKTKNELVDAKIIVIKNISEFPLKKDGWNFNWQKLYKEGGFFYKIITNEKQNEIQGILRFSIKNNEMIYLENIEVAPHNFGKNCTYGLVAGVLLAYCCKKSFTLAKNSYEGIVVFDSKTVLINFYRDKYGAVLLFGQRMCFYPENSKKLIDKYLKQR